MTKSVTVDRVCRALSEGNRERAAEVLSTEYPFTFAAKGQRRYIEYQMMQIFLRDGFIDRYSGERLVFPGTLRLLSQLMPGEFPAHKNWKMSESHQAFWELFPTIDHVVPVARGGSDDESNWVTTSMLRNSSKAHWTLEELGWRLHAPAPTDEWDGLSGWFLAYTDEHPEAVASTYLRKWRSAAVKALGGGRFGASR